MAVLLNPSQQDRFYPDARSQEVITKTIEFFESKGKRSLKDGDRNHEWYADFVEFIGRERIFATFMTPPEYGASDTRWDTWRMCGLGEVLGFYGLPYWYVWQVSVLGLGPIWMSKNEALKKRAAASLEDGGIFAFGLSERANGADVYSSSMRLHPADEPGRYLARGEKYYIGNGNEARMVSTFGKVGDPDEYVFFVADSQHDKYNCIRNVVNSQSYVAQYELKDYPIGEEDILSRGPEAWNSALNTVNVGKFNLGWASIGMCTHAFYEAITHAANRQLYGMKVTDFPHVKSLFVDAYARLIAMKLVALRAADYMRVAGPDDRRYLLFNPVVKMKVTTQGEDVINHLWDVIAAKGFERDMFFESAARDIRALPKLEGTVHVNVALIVKFMASYFFNAKAYEAVPRQSDARHDAFLFDQGETRGLGKIQFHDYNEVFAQSSLPNVEVFKAQIAVFKEMMMMATPDEAQRKNTELLLGFGQIFVNIVYAQLILENAKIYELDDEVVNRIFDVLVRDVSTYAVELHGRAGLTSAQQGYCLKLIGKPVVDHDCFDKVWKDHVLALDGAYAMPE